MTDSYTLAFNALRGIAACGTQCPCCQMLAGIARDVLNQIRENGSVEPRTIKDSGAKS